MSEVLSSVAEWTELEKIVQSEAKSAGDGDECDPFSLSCESQGGWYEKRELYRQGKDREARFVLIGAH